MPPSICHSCRQSLHLRLRQRLVIFQQSRRSFHLDPPKPPLALYWATPPPTERQLEAAHWFFENFYPNRLWTAEEWRKQNQPSPGQTIPEVAFLGRSNVGKSSLLNALLLKPGLNPVGPRPGKTIVMTAWGLSPTTKSGGALPGFNGDTSTRLTVLDVPGYGFKSQSPWGAEITKYLSRRKHLRKVFVLIDASHGIVARDKDMLQLLRSQNIPHQVIASKADALLGADGSKNPEHQEILLKIAHASQVKDPGELLVTGARRKKDHELSMEGIRAVRWSVLRAAGLDAYAYKEFCKTKKSSTTPDTKQEMTAPNPFTLPDFVYKNWIGGNSKPIMGGLPFLPGEDRLPGQPPLTSSELPSSHPRSQQLKVEPPLRPFSLRHGLDALLSPDQLVSQIRAKEPPPSPPSAPSADLRSTTLPFSPPADPRSRSLPSTTAPLTPTSAVPRGLDALLSLTQPKRKTRQAPNPTSRASSRRQQKSLPSSSQNRNSSQSPPSSATPPAQQASSFSGPGVSRGLDALISATQSHPDVKKKSKPSRGGARKRRY